MGKSEEIRNAVAQEYGRAVGRGSGGCCCPGPETKAVVTQMAGYAPEDLASVPPPAVGSSFGCGNPVALSGIGPGQTVLDVGCGAGLDLILAARRVGPEGRVIGVDMTEEMIARAARNVADAGLTNVEIRRGIIEELPVASASVDWVISNCAINLSPEKERVFVEIARVLKPGGRMLISDIVVTDLPAWARENQALYCACIGGAVRSEEYLAALGRAGLVEAEVRDLLVFDAAQIRAFLNAELLGTDQVPSCSCTGFLTGALAGRMAELLAGRVASARIYAAKPAV